MNIDLTTTLSIISILSVLFAVYSYFRNPQILTEKNESLMAKDVSQIRLDLTNLRDNHVHSLAVSLTDTNKVVSNLAIEVAKLSTIIDERIPKKI